MIRIKDLAEGTKRSYDSVDEVKMAFRMGLLTAVGALPAEGDLGSSSYDEHFGGWAPKIKDYDPNWRLYYSSKTGDAWHGVYRALRAQGWKRIDQHLEGSFRKYVLRYTNESFPEEFRVTTMIFLASVETCQRVKVGTRMVEEDVYETKCEDLKEIEDDVSGSVESDVGGDILSGVSGFHSVASVPQPQGVEVNPPRPEQG